MDLFLMVLSSVSMILNSIMLYQVVSQIPTWKQAAVILWLNAIVFNVLLVVAVAF